MIITFRRQPDLHTKGADVELQFISFSSIFYLRCFWSLFISIREKKSKDSNYIHWSLAHGLSLFCREFVSTLGHWSKLADDRLSIAVKSFLAKCYRKLGTGVSDAHGFFDGLEAWSLNA